MSELIEPKYVEVDAVRTRLANKVIIQPKPHKASDLEGIEDGQLPYVLFLQLIADAETQIEQELRSRYAVPFRSISKGSFLALPYHTKRALCQVIEDQAVLLVLETDFGTGTHINAEGYKASLQSRLDKRLELLLGRDREGASAKIDRYKNAAPLEDLALAPWNSEADDGYAGTVIVTGADYQGSTQYAEGQINNPARSFFAPYALIRGGR